MHIPAVHKWTRNVLKQYTYIRKMCKSKETEHQCRPGEMLIVFKRCPRVRSSIAGIFMILTP